MIGCSSKSIITGAIGGFTLRPLNPDVSRPQWLVAEAEVLAFIEQREKEAAVPLKLAA